MRDGSQIPEERLTKFLEAYIESGFNATDAGIEAFGWAEKTARSNAHRYVAAIRSRLDMQKCLDAAGLTPDRIARKLNMLLDADTVKWNPETGEWDTFADGSLQLETLKTLAKLRNYFPAEPTAQEQIVVNVVVDNRITGAPSEPKQITGERI